MSNRRWWFCVTVSVLGAGFATFQWIRHALGYSTLWPPERLHVLYGPLVLLILLLMCRSAYPDAFRKRP
jgi:hypothetical protein